MFKIYKQNDIEFKQVFYLTSCNISAPKAGQVW